MYFDQASAQERLFQVHSSLSLPILFYLLPLFLHPNSLIHHQHDLHKMELQRRAAQGRLSEVVGSNAVDVDKFFRYVFSHCIQDRKLLCV